MTDSSKKSYKVQSTAGKSFRKPVETFETPVPVLPKTNTMVLAESIAIVNPAIQKFFAKKIDEEKPELIAEGMNMVMSADNDEMKNIVADVKKRDGSRAARNLIGNNFFTQAGVERQLAINLGNAAEASTKSFFENYTVQVENTDGSTTPMSLSQFDVESNEFKTAIKEFNEQKLTDTKGINAQALNQFFYPYQNKALKEVYSTHQEQRADTKIGLMETSFGDSSFINFLNINSDNDDQDDWKNKLTDTQNDLNILERGGLTESVSPSGIVKIMKKNVNSIIAQYENGQLDWVEAEATIYDYIDFMKMLKVGPVGYTKDKTPIQKTLGEYTDKDASITEMLTEVYEIINNKKAEEVKIADYLTNQTIDQTLESLDFSKEGGIQAIIKNSNTISSLINEYPEQVDEIKNKYANLNFNVDAWWLDFHRGYNNGRYKDKRQARETLYSFMNSLGPSATTEDYTRFNSMIQYIEKNSNKGLFESRPELKRLIKHGDSVLSVPTLYGRQIKNQYVQQKWDLDEDFRKKLDAWSLTADDGKKEQRYQDLLKTYKSDLKLIRNGDYNYKNPDNNIFEVDGFETNKENENTKKMKDFFGVEGGAISEGGQTTFEVESGDTLSGIANDLDTSVEAIKKANGLTSDTIQVGEVLVIPEGIYDLNKVKAPEFDINKLITEKDHSFKPVRQKHNFQVIYNLAKNNGIKFPEVVAAQFGVESVYGSKVTGTNNYFGIKADQQDIRTGNFTEADTFEEIDGKMVKVRAKFKNFKTLEESIQHYKKFWNDDFQDRKGIVNVDTAKEAIIRLKENGYATDSSYVKLVEDVLNDAISDKLF